MHAECAPVSRDSGQVPYGYACYLVAIARHIYATSRRIDVGLGLDKSSGSQTRPSVRIKGLDLIEKCLFVV